MNTLQLVLGVNERLGGNWTSSQLLSVLDDLLMYAVESVVRNTDWMDSVVASVITWYTDNTRRKIASNTKYDPIDALLSFMVASDVDYKMDILRKMGLERGLWFKALRTFLNTCPKETSEIHNAIYLVKPGRSLQVVRRDVQIWYDLAVDMKSMIMEKYMRHVGNHALYLKRKNPAISLDDAVQNLFISLGTAIDKCSSDKGTLTTYVNQWFMSAQSKSRHQEYGLAYTVPDNVRQQFYDGRPSNMYVPLDDLYASGDFDEESSSKPHTEVEGMQSTLHFLKLARHADPTGFARVALKIQELPPFLYPVNTDSSRH